MASMSSSKGASAPVSEVQTPGMGGDLGTMFRANRATAPGGPRPGTPVMEPQPITQPRRPVIAPPPRRPMPQPATAATGTGMTPQQAYAFVRNSPERSTPELEALSRQWRYGFGSGPGGTTFR